MPPKDSVRNSQRTIRTRDQLRQPAGIVERSDPEVLKCRSNIDGSDFDDVHAGPDVRAHVPRKVKAVAPSAIGRTADANGFNRD